MNDEIEIELEKETDEPVEIVDEEIAVDVDDTVEWTVE